MKAGFLLNASAEKNVPFSLASVCSNVIENSGFWNLIEVVAQFCWSKT
tara:strand:+ start:217 stop:360 length:144 start_codon:yes stop_codon:yes gene_type:complete